jgi:hypothetical protein
MKLERCAFHDIAPCSDVLANIWEYISNAAGYSVVCVKAVQTTATAPTGTGSPTGLSVAAGDSGHFPKFKLRPWMT